MRRVRSGVWAAALSCFVIDAAADTGGLWRLDSFGVYGGPEPTGLEDYRQVDGVLNFSTPIQWEPIAALRFALHIQTAAGATWTAENTAFTGGAGPRFLLSYGSLPLWLEVGSRAGWISRDRFGHDDLGGTFQVTSHAAIGFKGKRLRIGVRMQHTSNAGIYSANAGYEIVGGLVEYDF